MEKFSMYKSLATGEAYSFTRHSLLLTTTLLECNVSLHVNSSNAEEFDIEPRQQFMLVLAPGTIRVNSGELFFLALDFTRLVKLQVFIDKALLKKSRETAKPIPAFSYLSTKLNAQPTTRDIEYWLLNQSLKNSTEIEAFSAVLRNNECYELIDFLLGESCANTCQQLKVICSRYGLSASHFRRLSRQALGKTTKVEMREWRLVRALLELVAGENNFTTIAMNHGYASLSHFSNEMKDSFGISPRNLKKILTAR